MTALDWHKITNQLLSISTDRAALVWSINEGTGAYGPSLSVIKEAKANIDGQWNTRGDKFCVSSASGNVFIATYSKSNNFWIGMPISKECFCVVLLIIFICFSGGRRPLHKSSVVSVRFDPLTSRVCASASTDGKCYITSCYSKGLDDSSTSGPFGQVTSFGEKLISLN